MTRINDAIAPNHAMRLGGSPAGCISRNGSYRIYDLQDMPDFNANTGSHAHHSVSDGMICWHPEQKVSCLDHGAMNAVNPDCTIWRCLACHVGAYVVKIGRGLTKGSQK